MAIALRLNVSYVIADNYCYFVRFCTTALSTALKENEQHFEINADGINRYFSLVELTFLTFVVDCQMTIAELILGHLHVARLTSYILTFVTFEKVEK